MHDEDCSLNTFEMITSTNELMKEFIKQNLVIFRWHQLDLNDISVLQWWKKHKSMFLIVAFIVYQILSIVGSQIIIFDLIRILINLRKYL